MKTNESILLYNFNNKEKNKKIKIILIQMGIKIKTADHSHLGEKIGYLFGIKEVAPSGNSEDFIPFEGELLVMRGFTKQRLNLFLAQLKKQGISIPYKAILTEFNQDWTLKQLYEEISREHSLMSKKKES